MNPLLLSHVPYISCTSIGIKLHPLMRLILLLFLGCSLLVFAGCDEDPAINPAEVAGEYEFAVYRFELQGGGFAPDANVLDTLSTVHTTLKLFKNNKFFLEYRFKGEAGSSLLSGTFSLQSEEVVLRFDRGSASELRELLMPEEIAFSIRDGGNRLVASLLRENVRLDQFDARYGTFEYDGVLRIEVRRR